MPKFGGNIPKYILKRIIAPDGLRLEGNELKLEVKNVLRPIITKNFPSNAKDFLTVSIDDEIITSEENNALMDNVKVNFKGETVPFMEINQIDEIGVGESIIFVIPNVKNLQKGETHKLTFSIKNDPRLRPERKKNKPKPERPPMKFEVEREIQ